LILYLNYITTYTCIYIFYFRGFILVRTQLYNDFLGSSDPMKDVFYTLGRASANDAHVFITGETGTGKELCARYIHANSRRFKLPFIAINCATISSDLLEAKLFGDVQRDSIKTLQAQDGAVQHARNGTLFLKKIDKMALPLQTKLLRFLQCRHFQKRGSHRIYQSNIRIICASTDAHRSNTPNSLLQHDLFYRLSLMPIHLPALRERDHDVLEIARSFLHQSANAGGLPSRSFSSGAERLLLEYHWPGNVRELKNILQHIMVRHTDIIITKNMLLGTGNITPNGYHSALQ